MRLIQIHSKDIALVSITISRIQTTVIPHYIIILSLTCVPPAASCYKGVCHFMCSHSGLVLLLPSLPRCRCRWTTTRRRNCDTSKSGTYQRNGVSLFCSFFFSILYCMALTWVALNMFGESSSAGSWFTFYCIWTFFFVLIFRFGCWLPARSMVWLWYLDGWFVGWVCCFFRCISFVFFG